jgi:hypothetical protein
MGKVLSYNKKSNGEDWFSCSNAGYTDEDIKAIRDPNGGLAVSPKTAIPSPFAQMDLVKNAFAKLSEIPDLNGSIMDRRLVSNALDIAQLFFNYATYQDSINIIIWDKEIGIEILKNNSKHKLLGDTLEMYLRQDNVSYNFDLLDKLYFLSYKNQIIGSTSPASLFLASPDTSSINMLSICKEIAVDGEIKLFEQWRPLYKRDKKFVKYIYILFGAYPVLRDRLSTVNKYLIQNFNLLANYNPVLYDEISALTGNPETATGIEKSNALQEELYKQYTPIENGVSVLGFPLFKMKAENMKASIAASDFVIKPSRVVDDEHLPLVLQNNLCAPASDPFKYIGDRNWNDQITVPAIPSESDPNNRKLPETNITYPWLGIHDFLEPFLIQYIFPIDNTRFFDGNIRWETKATDQNGFLLPVKPLFFKYFNIEDLMGEIGGKPKFEIERKIYSNEESVTAHLRIPVAKNGGVKFITLSRTYRKSDQKELSFNVDKNEGVFVSLPFTISILPFVRLNEDNQYRIQVLEREIRNFKNHTIDILFFKNGHKEPAGIKDKKQRSKKSQKLFNSNYYEVNDAFDYIQAQLISPEGITEIKGIIIPLWPEPDLGITAFTFAVDFGTTNTHIEIMQDTPGCAPEALKIDRFTSGDSLVATLYQPHFHKEADASMITFRAVQKQEFVPNEINRLYGFPQRTVLAESENFENDSASEEIALCDANIPFIYEKEPTGYNRIITNLKWSSETIGNEHRIKAYITELLLLMRAKVLLSKGDLEKTKLIWFFPLTMKRGRLVQLENVWRKSFKEIFNIQGDDSVLDKKIIMMTESIAPYYFYKLGRIDNTAASNVVSIDIGGGTSDVVIFTPQSKEPFLVTSFRFAANVLFGDAFTEIGLADSNPMILHYTEYFRNLFASDSDRYGQLKAILSNIETTKKSEDINAFLFSVENSPCVQGNDVFSYNHRLSEDSIRKIIFLYFYAAILYFVAKLMIKKQLEKPKSIMFSGTGSKVLDIIGNQKQLNLFTKEFLEEIFNKKYDADGFSIIMEKKEPKQITCKGGLVQAKTAEGRALVNKIGERILNARDTMKINYSMIEKENLVYNDMKDPNILDDLVAEVNKFNEFFINYCTDCRIVDFFLIDKGAFNQFKIEVGKHLKDYLLTGWEFNNRNSKNNDTDPIEDAPVFYPIIASIRNNLIENLK